MPAAGYRTPSTTGVSKLLVLILHPMFERGPFSPCPKCHHPDGVGLLSAGGQRLTMRCKVCRYTSTETLPALDKKVIYFDQLAFSELFKVQAGTRKGNAPHNDFWQELYERVRRVLLLQQAIFPASDIHSSETIVSPFPNELRDAYESLGGDVSFESADKIVGSQVWECFSAYREGRDPVFTFDVDDILQDERNAWLSDMRVTVNADYSHFADGIRESRARTTESLIDLVAQWAAKQRTFRENLRIEIENYGQQRVGALRHLLTLESKLEQSDDPLAFLEVSGHPVFREFQMLLRNFQKDGLPRTKAMEEVVRFWHWPGNWQQPNHRISGYLFAALARKVTAGQRKPPTRGFINDVKAISAYSPYVDAMFLDNECAGFLNESPLREELNLRTRIFSLNTRHEFLSYLADLERQAPAEVRHYATRIYGLG